MRYIRRKPMSAHLTLTTPVANLHQFRIARVGPVTSRKLASSLASISHKQSGADVTVEDLLNYLPLRYEDRSNLSTIRDLRPGLEAALELSVKIAGGYQVGRKRAFGRPKLFKFEISATDPKSTGRPVKVWWFVSGANSHDIINYYSKRFTQGTRFITFGRWDWDDRIGTYSLQLHKPPDELELLAGQPKPEDAENQVEIEDELEGDPAIAAIHAGRSVPVYRKLGDLSSKRLREIIYALLDAIPAESFTETLPKELRRRQHLIERDRAYREIHFPSDPSSLPQYERQRSPAQIRFIFEEFFLLALRLLAKRGSRVKEIKGSKIVVSESVKKAIAAVMPFKLTKAQRRTVAKIFADLQSNAPMNRLLQGDVGSGKTIVALIAMMAVMENGYQTTLMAPTEILAEQHARNIKRLLATTQYRVELLTGSLKAADKQRLRAALAAGEIDAIIGTHALIQESVSFKKLGLVVIDEQHRFGVLQRAELRTRGLNPDVLVLTATPIPRSLAMTVYGDLDVSVIDELPPGRTPVETRVFGEDQRTEVKRLIEHEVKKGQQVYVVYPLVEESEKMDLRAATKRYEYLRQQVFPRFNIGLLHGKMKSAEKDQVMQDFVAGKVQILVSTTVVEVGVDVPNASVMIVEHAERFGLSQLHQLRGRVGRGAEKSYCILLTSDKQTIVASERLGIMSQTNDGFVIAEKDLELRGPGELMGTKQSGLPELRHGNLIRDQEILEKARGEAEFYLSNPEMSQITDTMMRQVEADSRFGLAEVG